ncbi:MAG: butanol dehydrogenase [Thermoleophilia bacterium]|nr:butanol dehydrogenase [Thermoleophilia bacterium]
MPSTPVAGASSFHVSQPTQVVAGHGLADRLGDYVASYGNRALLVVGDAHARASGLLARVEGSLAAAGVAVEGLEGVPPNPSVATVDAGATLARAWRADVIVGIGGGSVIDVAKAISVAAAMDTPGTFRNHLSGIRTSALLVSSTLPCVAVPTLPGSGSETNGTSVITDDETGRKLSAHSDLAAPRMAVLDADLLVDAPLTLLGPGLADAVCHAIEAMLSLGANIASDSLAEQAIRLLVRRAPQAMDLELGRDERRRALLDCWWATNLAGQALTLAGSIVTHPLAHPLSGRLDVRHGLAVAALEPAVLAVLAPRLAGTGGLERVAAAFDVRPGDHDALLRGVLTRLGKFCAAVDVRTGAADFGLAADAFDLVARDARMSGSRGLGNVPGGEVTSEELYAILELACAITPVAPAKRILQLRSSQASAQQAAAASLTRA